MKKFVPQKNFFYKIPKKGKFYKDHVVLMREGWVKVGKIEVSESDLIKKDPQSKFFKFPVSDWVSYRPSVYNFEAFTPFRRNFVFVDIEKGMKPNDIDKYFFNFKKMKKEKIFNMQDFTNIKKEALNAMVQRYKLHLQVDWSYLKSFIEDFTKFILTDKRCKYVYEFKYPKKISKEWKRKKDALPRVVAYVSLIPGSKEEKNKVLKQIIDAIIERYGPVAKKIGLNIAPRYSRRIKDFIYLAGGDGDDKKHYIDLIKDKKNKINKNKIYTKDFAFFKGYEFDYKFDKDEKNQKK